MKLTLWGLIGVVGLATLTSAGDVQAQVIGQKDFRSATYGASANWDTSSSGKAVIEIPRGWVIIDQRDERSSNFGRTSLNTQSFPANAHYVSNTEVESRFQEVSDHMFKIGNYAGQRRAEEVKNQWLRSRSNISSSFAAIEILVTATGSGNFFDRKGASIQGRYVVTIQYVGTTDALKTAVNDLMKSAGPPQPQPQAASRTLLFPSGGRVRKQADGSWVEMGSNGKFVSRFRQISQDANVLVIREDARRFTLTIPLAGGQIVWQYDGQGRLNWGIGRWE